MSLFLMWYPPHQFKLQFNNLEIRVIIHDKALDMYGGKTGKLPLPAVSIIKRFESFYPYAYPDPLTRGKPITIGWGSTQKRDGSPWHLGERITRKAADELLLYQLEFDYLPKLREIPGWNKLNVRQQGALLSFSYNVGAKFYGRRDFRTITRVLDWRDFKHIKPTLLLYRNPGTRVEGGLRNRRLTEAYVFLH